MITPDRKEALKYLGFNGAAPDGAVTAMLEEAENALLKAVTPKTVSRRFNCEVTEDGVAFGGYVFKSKKLSKHLEGCKELFLISATLGVEADNLIRRLSVTDISKAAVMQAASAALIESVLDELSKSLENELEGQGLFLKPRFSPGYGDFDIKYQKEVFALLDCQKRIGLSLSDSFMMSPTKSVTAVIGITKDKQCHSEKCRLCPNTECEFREEQK